MKKNMNLMLTASCNDADKFKEFAYIYYLMNQNYFMLINLEIYIFWIYFIIYSN